MDNPIGRGLLNGWQLSGISSLASGIPYRLSFSGAAGAARSRPPTSARPTSSGRQSRGGNGLAPVYTCDPTLGGKDVGEKILDINCIAVPAFGENGELVPPYNLRTADAVQPRPDAVQELHDPGRTEDPVPRRLLQPVQPGVRDDGHDGNDINLVLDTTCNVIVPAFRTGRRHRDGHVRPDAGLLVHAADHRELRQDQPEARPPRRRVRAEVLLLGPDHTDHTDHDQIRGSASVGSICTTSTGARAGRLSPRSCYQAVYSGDPSRHCQWPAHRRSLLPVLLAARAPDLSGPAAGQVQSAPDAERLFARAIELHQAGDILGAIDTYKAVLAIAPDRADALSNLGAAYVRLGQYDDAIAQYALALKADPGQRRDSPESRARLLQVGAPAPGDSRAQARRGVGARGAQRLSRAGRVLPADRSGQRGRRAAEAARADVRPETIRRTPTCSGRRCST